MTATRREVATSSPSAGALGFALAFALELLDWAATVTVVTDGRRFQGDDDHRRSMGVRDVALIEGEAVALSGRQGDLTSVLLGTGEGPASRAALGVD